MSKVNFAQAVQLVRYAMLSYAMTTNVLETLGSFTCWPLQVNAPCFQQVNHVLYVLHDVNVF